MSIITIDKVNLITPWSTDLEKLIGSQLVTKYLAIYGIKKSIISFTSARQLSLSSARSSQSLSSHPTSWRSTL